MKKYLVAAVALGTSSASHAALDLTSLWAEVDLSGIATSVLGVGVTAVGIAVAFKSIRLAKRAVGLA
ncbi:phage coat protein [Vibrio sp. SCSIO 43135]|uniref:phage coat protein n=1 Tax=Vibrio sp. SCSIO 43135 TaxID=2819096 RepID=UPI0020752E6C|nr:phage coat protein [Vibrio sp. SCSIO 43135]USD44061.1 phage coat protein [Vibrio sp. SCSIO 43135]USD44070.1 phage coat protein [Vibrio sp. SCSIO 43135]USD44079.1 phage coat protein [Vibrio sp. SCSIO 43135]